MGEQLFSSAEEVVRVHLQVHVGDSYGLYQKFPCDFVRSVSVYTGLCVLRISVHCSESDSVLH